VLLKVFKGFSQNLLKELKKEESKDLEKEWFKE
jgi:hypothetical protein